MRLYGRFRDGGRSKIFGNADFGYTRVTVERPLRLRYRMTIDDKARFLDACPFLLDDVQVIDKALGRKPMRDWNAVWERIADLPARTRLALEEGWSSGCSVTYSPTRIRKPSPLRRVGGRKASSPTPGCATSRTFPLTEDAGRLLRARGPPPTSPDAWMDRSKDRVGYEINFNRHFYEYTPPRPLEEIDADLKKAEAEIVKLLGEVVG